MKIELLSHWMLEAEFRNLCFLAIYADLLQNWFVVIHALCVEKILAKNSVHGEKMTNIRYGTNYICCEL